MDKIMYIVAFTSFLDATDATNAESPLMVMIVNLWIVYHTTFNQYSQPY